MKIAICASMSFSKEILELKNKLEMQNHAVVIPANVDQYADGTIAIENKAEKMKLDVIRAYFAKLKDVDAILVLNKDKNGIENYVGGNSLIEIAFAHILNKKIFLFNPIPKMNYTDEIEAMGSVVIGGDLNKIM